MVSTRSNKKYSTDVENSSKLPDRKRAKSSEGDGPSSNPNNLDQSIFVTQVTTKARGISNETDDSNFYLLKSEPEPRMEKGIDVSFSIDDLAMREGQVEPWDGVRNYEARNTMQRMRVGEYGFFYHSNCKKERPGIVGIVRIVREAYPDDTSWNRDDPHYDPKSSKEDPRWFMVDVQFVRKFRRCVTLDEIKTHPQLRDMQLVKRGRISVQPVRKEEWAIILDLENKDAM